MLYLYTRAQKIWEPPEKHRRYNKNM